MVNPGCWCFRQSHFGFPGLDGLAGSNMPCRLQRLGKGYRCFLEMLFLNNSYGGSFEPRESRPSFSSEDIELPEIGAVNDVELTLKAENCRRVNHDDAPQIHQMPNGTPRMRWRARGTDPSRSPERNEG